MNSAGASAWATINPISGETVPAAPTNLKATWNSATWTANVSWNAVSGASYYEVQYCHTGKDDWAVETSYTNNKATSFVSEGVGHTQYGFRVRAVNSAGASAWTTLNPISHTHSMTHTYSQVATCTSSGNIEYWYCSGCGKYFTDSAGNKEITKAETIIKSLGHSLSHVDEKVATCTEDGNNEYWTCTRCGKYYSDSSATKEISKSQTIVSKHGHSLFHTPANDPTCTEDGNYEYWYCPICGEYFSDEAATAKTLLEKLARPKLGHLYEDDVCLHCWNPNPNGERVDTHFATVAEYVEGQFTDVPADQWFTDSVAQAVELGLLKGNGNGSFNPYGDVSIVETIVMASRVHSIYYTGSENFRSAVSGELWYQPYLDYAYSNGVISRTYYECDVTQKATRAQFAEIFANALPAKALYPMNRVAIDAIPDVSIAAAYGIHVYSLYRAGILAGSDANGSFYPRTYITRVEAAAIVSRMAKSSNRVSLTLI